MMPADIRSFFGGGQPKASPASQKDEVCCSQIHTATPSRMGFKYIPNTSTWFHLFNFSTKKIQFTMPRRQVGSAFRGITLTGGPRPRKTNGQAQKAPAKKTPAKKPARGRKVIESDSEDEDEEVK
jgi:hypothetical protein